MELSDRSGKTNSLKGIQNVTLPLKRIWVPKVLLKNSARKRNYFSFDNDFDYDTTFVTNDNAGAAYCETGGLMSFSCGADMTYFPADTQICRYVDWNYILREWT